MAVLIRGLIGATTLVISICIEKGRLKSRPLF
jgi:hypothetical protein